MLATLTAALLLSAAPLQERPDVLLVIVDDLGLNTTQELATPTLDAFAMMGARFGRGYSHARCQSTRDSLFRSAWAGQDRGSLCDSLPETRTLDHRGDFLGKSMAGGGYATAMVGKWHQGTAEPLAQRCSPGGPVAWPAAPHLFGWGDVLACIPDDTTACTPGGGDYTNWLRIDNGEQRQETVHATIAMRDELFHWWAENDDRPRFAVASFQACHHPYEIPPAEILPGSYVAPQNPTDREKYEAMVASVDFVLSEILVAIWHPDLWVIVIGDNGTPGCNIATGSCRRNVANPGLEFRSKLTTFETGVQVPFAVIGPGVASQDLCEPVHVVDLAPTILEIAGLDAPPSFAGESLLSAMLGAPSALRGWVVVSGTGQEVASIEVQWKLRRDRQGVETLFDLAADPDELAPIAPSMFPQVSARLRARLSLLD